MVASTSSDDLDKELTDRLRRLYEDLGEEEPADKVRLLAAVWFCESRAEAAGYSNELRKLRGAEEKRQLHYFIREHWWHALAGLIMYDSKAQSNQYRWAQDTCQLFHRSLSRGDSQASVIEQYGELLSRSDARKQRAARLTLVSRHPGLVEAGRQYCRWANGSRRRPTSGGFRKSPEFDKYISIYKASRCFDDDELQKLKKDRNAALFWSEVLKLEQ